jgi:choline dehydrogenase-like flavoprotein
VQGELTAPERWLRVLLIAHAIWSALLALSYLLGGDTASFGYMPNSFGKDVLFVALSLIAAADLRRFGGLALVIALGYVALVIGMIVTLAVGGSPDFDPPLIGEIPAATALAVWMGIDVLLVALFAGLWAASVRARHELRYLNPVAFVALGALAEVLIEGEEEVVPPDEIARNVDRYLAALEADTKGQVHFALTVLGIWPMVTLRPPLPVLSPPGRKRFLKKRFVEPIGERRVLRPVRPYIQALIRTGTQMSYLGYYGDCRVWDSIGYTPFKRRSGGRPPDPSDHPEPSLSTLKAPPRDRRDTIVVGSGAAGAILAARLAETGRRVLVVERGPHVDPRVFSDDEVDQYLRLYNEGALQLAKDFNFQVLQGMCVGGGTTINNALCLPPPDRVLAEWEQRGLDRAELDTALGAVRKEFRITEIRRVTTTKAAAYFEQGVRALGLEAGFEVMEANISEACLGTGYCNIGCAYGAKLTALDLVLPKAQRMHELDVLADFEVEGIDRRGDRATQVVGRHAPSGERAVLVADEIVVAAGAIGSSYLLQRSGLGGDAVGRDLHFNINSPLTADFAVAVDAFDGIQMSHAYRAGDGLPDYLIETWFNPPATQALAMPGWFDRHFENMLRYRHMACSGVLVGTRTPGSVKPGRRGPEIEYSASPADMDRMLNGLEQAGRIWFEAGAQRVMPATFEFHEYDEPKQLGRLRSAIRESGDLLMTSAHPQGGNALGSVVDAQFRVKGLANLYLCDASVFPSSVHVNPQLTVMAMAQYAAKRIGR